jgi:TolB-like protein
MTAEQSRVAVSARNETKSGAVFLSYASEDAAAAERIAIALRAAGIEVWFDKTELRGGDAWDTAIRTQIHECRLFIPVISTTTEARGEGYFRREWKFAVDRTHDLSERRAFLVPVVIDATPEVNADVPDVFRRVQWTRLPLGETTPAFVERIRRLLSPDMPKDMTSGSSATARPPGQHAPSWWSPRTLLICIVIAVVGALTYLAIDRRWASKGVMPTRAVVGTAAPAPFMPPPHSIAVLPFVNMSGDREQEYFSDGLTEEVLNALSRINELQVAARTSSFSFQGEHPDIATVAHKLNVAAVLEGSVRKAEHRVRVTAQLVNGLTGFHIWSQTYDRDFGDVLELQTDIATAVASALKVTLLENAAAKIEVGATRNPAAFDAYLRATKLYWSMQNAKDAEAAIAEYSEAIRLDPGYALAFAGRSIAFAGFATGWATSLAAVRTNLESALADARRAVALAPNLSDGYLALAIAHEGSLEFPQAAEQYERALTLGTGNARVLRDYGLFAAMTGHGEFGLTLLNRALKLDPLNPSSHGYLGDALVYLHRYSEAITAYEDAKALDSGDRPGLMSPDIGIAYYLLGDFKRARLSCEEHLTEDIVDFSQFCLAMTYEKLGRRKDAETMLTKLRARYGNDLAYAYGAIYAQSGDARRALDWLEAAARTRDPYLQGLNNPLLDPVRKDPRFKAIEQGLRFPDQAGAAE